MERTWQGVEGGVLRLDNTPLEDTKRAAIRKGAAVAGPFHFPFLSFHLGSRPNNAVRRSFAPAEPKVAARAGGANLVALEWTRAELPEGRERQGKPPAAAFAFA